MNIFIVAPCILKIHQLLKTNKCTPMYCVYSKTRIKTFKKLLYVSIYRSIDHHHGATLVELTKFFTDYFNILT
jgi:hypothetical protein